MEESNILEEEKEVAEKYQELLVNVLENKEANDKSQENIYKILKQANKLFKHIYTPSTLKLDARLIMESSEISSFNFERNIRTEDLSQDFFIESLRNKNGFIFAFLKIIKASHIGVKFPVMLNLEKKEDNEPIKEISKKTRVYNKLDLKSCETVIGSKFEAKDDSLDKINIIRNTILLLNKIEFYKLILDQNDFGNTIENIFYVSCAIKQNICMLIYENETFYIVQYSKNCKYMGRELSHLIIEFNLYKYLTLIEKYNDHATLLP